MIKANELRIGNWVFNEMTGQNVSATAMTIFAVSNDTEVAHEFYAIPLTPEILEKCGFEWLSSYECYTITTKTGEILLSKEYILQSTDTLTQLKYLHQLQNLYFALTGEELTVSL